SGLSARARCARTRSSSIIARISASPSTLTVLISCEVRKPSKKCTKGTRDRSVAACAISAASCASWTEPDDNRAKPVVRGDMEYRRRELAGDLEHVRDHQQQTLRRREGCRQRAGLKRPVQRAGGTPFALHLLDDGNTAPDILGAGGRPFV